MIYMELVSVAPWSDPIKAAPLADFFKMWKETKDRWHGPAPSASNGVAYMNQYTFGLLAANCNPADIYGRRTGSSRQGGDLVRALVAINELLANDDFPRIEIDQDLANDVVLMRGDFPNVRLSVTGQFPPPKDTVTA